MEGVIIKVFLFFSFRLLFFCCSPFFLGYLGRVGGSRSDVIVGFCGFRGLCMLLVFITVVAFSVSDNSVFDIFLVFAGWVFSFALILMDLLVALWEEPCCRGMGFFLKKGKVQVFFTVRFFVNI